MGKFYDIDPNTCSIEELKGAIASCNANVELFGALEQGCKKFINSVYGALGSRYYVCANTAIAESVTLQGQDLIKFSSRKVNYLVHELWHKINDVVKPKAFIMDENGNIVKAIVYTTHDEELECLCETGNYIFVSDDSILIGYDSFIDILKDNKDLKMVDCELVNGNKKTTGKKIELNYESLKYVRSYLNIYRRIAHDMVKINPEFDVDAFMVNCLTQVEYPKETQKTSSDTLDENGNPLKINTLQVYGDSCVGDTLIPYVFRGEENNRVRMIKISDLFNENSKYICKIHGKDYVVPHYRFRVINLSGNEVVASKVIHVVRHINNKRLFEIKCANDSSVVVTEDHSIMLYNTVTEKIEKVKPLDVDKSVHKAITTDGYKIGSAYVTCDVVSVEEYSGNDEYVYDIEVGTEDENLHNFFGNNILLHNTDSVSRDSIVRTKKHPEGITIEEFYNENKDKFAGTTLVGHESVSTEDEVLNWFNSLYYGKVERIIRHKVSKDEWKLKTVGGKTISCTGDHSLIVFKDGYEVVSGPGDIMRGDSVVVVDGNNFIYDEVESCEMIGQYEDEYVYDIEMEDETHTFICNDVLVHNSSYLTLQPLIESCKISPEMATKFILSFNEHVMSGYLNLQFESYAKKFNCPVNLENFELEKVARSVVMQKKKKYVMDIAWDDSNTFYEPLHKVTFSGVEAVKGESSKFIRNEQKEFVRWIIDNINNGKKLRYPEIVSKIKQIKDRFRMANPDDICITKSMSDYEKYILNDKGSTIRYVETLAEQKKQLSDDVDDLFDDEDSQEEEHGQGRTIAVPFHVKSAAWYNNLLYTTAKRYRSKYEIIHKGDKVRLYYVEDPMDDNHKTFAFLPGNFPIEFAPPIDMDTQFEKLILDPLNRYVEALGYNPIGAKLTYKTSLF